MTRAAGGGGACEGVHARFTGLNADQRRARYARLAEAALAHYALGEARAVFVGHNAGVVYRVETADAGRRFLLKIAEPAGGGAGEAPARLRAGLLWLAALARETALVVQEPVPNRRGGLLTAVPFGDLHRPFSCSLQRWVEGAPAAGDFTPPQAARVGAMMARLHNHGSRWTPPEARKAAEFGAAWLDECAGALRGLVELGLVSEAEWATVETACQCCHAVMADLGYSPTVWGPVHGDLHQQNLLFIGDEVRPIDFHGLSKAHFAYDLGVTLYHLLYLGDVAMRRALVAGYRSMCKLSALPEGWGDAFVCAAALANLAFNVTIPRERASPLFREMSVTSPASSAPNSPPANHSSWPNAPTSQVARVGRDTGT